MLRWAPKSGPEMNHEMPDVTVRDDSAETSADDAGPEPSPRPWTSMFREFLSELSAVEFGDRIILFGAALLLSVLPLVILLSALASQRVDDDIAVHLGLSRQGAHVVEGLFSHHHVAFNLGIFVSLVLSFAGTVAVARSVQQIYEAAFACEHARGLRNFLRCVLWVLITAGLLIGESAFGQEFRNGVTGPLSFAVFNVVAFSVYFWWSAHFLLGGRERWRAVLPVGVATSLFWTGLGVFAAFYFSSTVISDSKLYGNIGVVFTLVTWFIAMGAVIALGAVAGVLWGKHRPSFRRASTSR